jgi:dTDP-4-dehydrorhamnose reductase
MKILIVGANGMLGNMVVRVLAENLDNQVFGSVRDDCWKNFFSLSVRNRIISGIDVMNFDVMSGLFKDIAPDLVINCAGVTKHNLNAEDALVSISINSLLPHQLANLCKSFGARMIHISTDCVFSGKTGSYTENDMPDAWDLYGKSKLIGEVLYPHTITLRTSIIGHELQTKYGLLEWFLSQKNRCNGFAGAIFSGFPTVVLAQIIRDVIIPNAGLSGLYNVATNPISKFELLSLIAKIYKKEIQIIEDDSLMIDRSLNADRFRLATGYEPPAWPELIKTMHAYK